MSLKARKLTQAARRQAQSPFRVDDLWTPSAGGLPGGAVLAAIAERCGRAWGMGGLARRARIGYNDRLRTTAGRALLKAGRVELNPRLLASHPVQLVPTLVHELAHLAVFWRHGRAQPHGEQFTALMRAVNLPAGATHRLETGGLRRRRYLYLHRCGGCGSGFIGRRVRRDCHCGACGPGMGWEIFRSPATAEGQARLQVMLAAAARQDGRACGPREV